MMNEKDLEIDDIVYYIEKYDDEYRYVNFSTITYITINIFKGKTIKEYHLNNGEAKQEWQLFGSKKEAEDFCNEKN